VVPPLACSGALVGAHQRQNAGLAAAAAEWLAQPDQAAIERGLAGLRWPGRFEVVERAVVLDGAHNDASAQALAATLADCGGRPLHLVVGINRDKDARAVLRPLLPLSARVWATRAVGSPRALEPARLAGLCRRLGHPAAAVADVAEALRQARAAEPAGLVVVTGSLALVGEARAALGLPVPERLW
jgi:folylpolyglutamate synthase/dihydropteroate synthase